MRISRFLMSQSPRHANGRSKNIFQVLWRQRHQLGLPREPGDGRRSAYGIDLTDVTDILGEDEVRGDLLPQTFFYIIEAFPLRFGGRKDAVDLGARAGVTFQQATDKHRLAGGCRALEGDAIKQMVQTHVIDHPGGGWEE